MWVKSDVLFVDYEGRTGCSTLLVLDAELFTCCTERVQKGNSARTLPLNQI